ncbi:dihydroorotase [Clostridiaceae bacterium 68-1-5]|uniref:Dihydroorotase n=1 Tax=Suipraeoptans intestinalis TaxID=2606628 RepID=A0A6N7V551_9FIRM|nr:dihydroorotase [Suipraeoptans intestinalis]MSR94312.1 dihydroorotase [Suipraeoptans intestinalis]
MVTLIRNGQILDPRTGRDEVGDIWIRGDRIIDASRENPPLGREEADLVIDAEGCWVMPGLIDLHVHLRDPGFTYKETLETGGKAAVKGGITTVCAMPNTNPPIDDGDKVKAVHDRAKVESPARVIQLGAVTKEQGGKSLADIRGMAKAGCHAISEDGKSVVDAGLYRQAMKLAKEEGLSVFAHCEEIRLVEDGVMNAGARARELGLRGITNSVEDVIVARDILLAKETGVKLHLCHCSTKDSVAMVEAAKEAGLAVTAEVCPHHLILTAEEIPEDDGNYKMNPPLRDREDVEALRRGLAEGILDAVATDHAPHAGKEKDCSMKEAAFGVVGLETSLPLIHTELVKTGILGRMEMVERMSTAPARILGLSDRGSLTAGCLADITIFDPRAEGKIQKETFVSKGTNTPFAGRSVQGQVKKTLVGGKVVYEAR